MRRSASSCPIWVNPPAISASTISCVLVGHRVPLATVTGCSVLSYGAAGVVGVGVADGGAWSVGVADGDGVCLPSGSVRSMSFFRAAKSCDAPAGRRSSRFGSLAAGAVGTATKATLLTSIVLSRFPMVIIDGTDASPSSTVRFCVTTSAILSIFTGSDRVPSSLIFRVSEDRKPCWALMRPRSPPSAKACRVRRKARACSPFDLGRCPWEAGAGSRDRRRRR